MLKKVRELVKKEAREDDWKYHFIPIVKYSKQLAKSQNVNQEIVELAALLHDIGRIKHGGKNHDITGIPEAEKILKKLNAPRKVIDEVKHCIQTHRGSKDFPPKTIIAKIIANADAMSHFDIILKLFEIGIKRKKLNFEECLKGVEAKLDRDWNKKLTIPKAREITKEKYQAIKLILNSNKEYM
ncbi:MAG: HD domain-containing protein [Candidatus Woesearchaeota archaeon]